MTNIVLMGKPNVGKSSLFNRILKRRIAITSDVSGTTRDASTKEALINDLPVTLTDTGGLDDSSVLYKAVKKKSLETAKTGDIILFLVDGKLRPDDEDKQIFYKLQKLNKPLALIINKIDNDKDIERSWEFENFGAKFIFPISVSHNLGLDELYNWINKNLKKAPNEIILEEDEAESLEEIFEEENSLTHDFQEEIEDGIIKIGIIGRVNVGKSSLLNSLTNKERAVVSEIAGTTIDPVNESIDHEDYVLEFIDTAGLRKRGKIEGIEKFALKRTQDLLEQAHIALLVLDASEPLKELDERIAGLVEKYELGCIIVLNKWDKAYLEFDEFIDLVRDKFKFLAYAPIITVSALSKKRVYKIKDLITQVYKNFSQRIPTAKLNTLFDEATRKHLIPSDKGKKVKIYYATQFGTKPPKIALVMNRPRAVHFSYKRYLVNQLREKFDFSGSPLILIPKNKSQKNEEE